MNTKLPILFFGFVVLWSCSSDDNSSTCGIDDPVNELPWLMESIAELQAFDDENDLLQYFYVVKASYGIQTVFIVDNCCPFCNTAIYVLDCEGESLGQLNVDISREDIKDSTIIYKPDNFACNP